MIKGLVPLVIAQFLSAFADNAILFTVIAIVLQGGERGEWYIPALQSVFLVAYVTLAPWVGIWADRLPKPQVLIIANLIKTAGGGLLLAGIEPLIAYSLVGAGAALYSPAKYGILPEIADEDQLVKANGWVEGATIAAILLGTVGGARIADQSIPAALFVICGCFLLSTLVSLTLPGLPARRHDGSPAVQQLVTQSRILLKSQRARLVLLGLAMFWAAAATLRVVLVAWAPAVLHTQTATDIAELTLFTAIGIVIGAALAPSWIPLSAIRRTRYAGYAIALMFGLLAASSEPWPARTALLGIGVAGGFFVVPLNAAIQDIGHRGVGAGITVAIQNFFLNAAMLVAVGLYTAAAARGADPVMVLLVMGAIVLVFVARIAVRLPRNLTDT
ncbi:lysophospholipid transporter LplT [Methylococcus geothermalis]|uniref:Lysophospholipid transporter LplT n=1 Tax=Methylococcus geothermalis TaxID=2681310 RepID=A0A858Q6J5_9GAMM|nr:lysophospholipid transporter LplT [Methylococcus geothermalis]QJD29488.1 lysophospholipid transporter LplT [Methylococcus geothermalis]